MKKAALLVFIFAISVQFARGACLKNVLREAPTDRFIIDGETVTDQYTGLIWQRCALGQEWLEEKKRCNLNLEKQRLFTWPQALQAAQENRLGGRNDWRLPNKVELSSIVERACSAPAINETAFPDTTSAEFWTSTPGRREGGYAWRVDFKTGNMLNIFVDNEYSVRLVRDGEN